MRVLSLEECQALSRKGIMVVDCETTGLESDSRVIQFGAVFLTDFGVYEGSYYTYLAADGWVGTDEAQAVHGITPTHLEHAPQFSDAVLPLIDLFTSRKVVAHRASFDQGRLMYEFSLVRESPTPPFYCSKLLCESLGYGPLRLQEAATKFGINPGKAHDAGDDAMTVALLLRHFLHKHQFHTLSYLRSAPSVRS